MILCCNYARCGPLGIRFTLSSFLPLGICINLTTANIIKKATHVINDKDAAGICAAANLYGVYSLESFEWNAPEITPTRTTLAFIEKFTTEKTSAAETTLADIVAQCLTLVPQSK